MDSNDVGSKGARNALMAPRLFEIEHDVMPFQWRTVKCSDFCIEVPKDSYNVSSEFHLSALPSAFFT
jgi:hypothetical protein